MSEKMWGAEPFWGLGYEWDPDWVYTDRQKELRALLIELCEQELRANAKRSDDELLYPRRNLELLGEHGFLGLTVPEEYGGLGENHVAFAMACETIARYGCASTAMCYVMHIGAVMAIMNVRYADLGTEVEVGKLDGFQKRIPATVVRFPFYDPDKSRPRS